MGIAAYNRASSVIRLRISQDDRPVAFQMMEDFNNLEKYDDAGAPFGDLIFTFSRGVWWVNAASHPDGYGYYYKSLREAIKRWKVVIVEFNNGTWRGVPSK